MNYEMLRRVVDSLRSLMAVVDDSDDNCLIILEASAALRDGEDALSEMEEDEDASAK